MAAPRCARVPRWAIGVRKSANASKASSAPSSLETYEAGWTMNFGCPIKSVLRAGLPTVRDDRNLEKTKHFRDLMGDSSTVELRTLTPSI
jgi:hypothetical protein